MKVSFCRHAASESVSSLTSTACPHVFGLNEGFKFYTGKSQNVIYRCSGCEGKKNHDHRPVCHICISKLEENTNWYIQGLPEIKKAPIPFILSSRKIVIPRLINRRILASASNTNSNHLIIFSDQGELLLLDCGTGQLIAAVQVDIQLVIREGVIQLILSGDSRYCAVTSCVYRIENHDDSNKGVVIELQSGRIVKSLDCDNYHMALAPFPVTFFDYKSRTCLVYASEWNKLDILDLESGDVLSERDLDQCPENDDDESDISFTEWSGALVVSPDQKRIASVGWVWHPIGVAYSFDAIAWVEKSCWESDCGKSKKIHAAWDYFWDSPLVWIDETRLCIWGAQSDYSGDPPDCVAIYDAGSNKMVSFFTGPTIDFFVFDEYLFSGLRDSKGISMWSVDDGSLVYEASDLHVDSYVKPLKEFVTFGENGELTFTRWERAN